MVEGWEVQTEDGKRHGRVQTQDRRGQGSQGGKGLGSPNRGWKKPVRVQTQDGREPVRVQTQDGRGRGSLNVVLKKG